MVGGVGMGTSAGGGGGEGFDGGATKSWVNTNFVSIEFFGRLFKAYGPGENQGDPDVEVLPNDMDSTISNIEAMFGFWTDFYLTALGNGGEIGASVYLAGLKDVNVEGVKTGQVLTWNSATSKWIASTPSSGVDMTVVWGALAANTNEQINASHLSTALTEYATQTDLNRYLPLTGGTLTNTSNILNISSLNENSWIYFLSTKNGTSANRGSVGYYNSFAYVANETTYARIGVADDGTPQYWPDATGNTKYTLIHTGNRERFDGTLSIFPGSNQNWREGIRIHSATNGWSTLILCGPDNTGDSGTSANSWSMHSYSGDFYLNRNGSNTPETYLLCNVSGNWGIGTNSPSYKLHVSGSMCASGTGTFGNVYSNGYVTALSDEREKNIIEEFEIPLDFIAKAPIVSYEWKDKERRGDKQHIGSIAQYWLREMPELVPEVNGRYTMDYGRIALLSAILTARHVVNLEQRIAQLEKALRGE